jgi:4-hydroxybenzoate polyprenyltransferase
MPIDVRRLLRISRPKFWLYLLGPYVLGAVLAIREPAQLLSWPFQALVLWFTFPANLLLYGVNDAADYDTDRHNPKKVRGEALVHSHERRPLLLTILALALLALPALVASGGRVALAVLLFVALAVAYSAPPVRLKARPVLDSLSNALYLAPMLAGWWAFTAEPPAPALVLAGTLWCAAMHAYSAVPDIAADRRAGLSTIATLLGRTGTLAACALSYGGAALLAGLYDLPSGLLLALYPAVMVAQLALAPDRVPRWYRYFPLLNGLAGMGLTLRFLWPLAR